MRIWLSQTMGEAWPEPGTGVFQRMFEEADQCKGGLVSRLDPSPLGPRQAGQFSAWAGVSRRSRKASGVSRGCMVGSCLGSVDLGSPPLRGY